MGSCHRVRLKHHGLIHKIKSPFGTLLFLNIYYEIILGALCSVYNNNIPKTFNDTIATFADDTALLATGDSVIGVTPKLLKAVNKNSSDQFHKQVHMSSYRVTAYISNVLDFRT